MENQKIFKTPNKALARMQIVRFGKILFNIQLIMALIVASPLPYAIYPLYYAVLVIISIFSAFVLFLYPEFVALWNPSRIYTLMNSVTGAYKYTVPIVIGLSLLTILLLSFDKNNRHLKRIIASIIIIAIVIIYLIFRLSIV